MDELFVTIREFLQTHLVIVILIILGTALLLYGLTIFDSKREKDVVFDAGDNSASEVDQNKEKYLLLVDVSGAVTRPGVYKLPADSRVQDALFAAGGMSKDADQLYVAKQLNLAAKVTDGAKLYIPMQGDATIQAVAGSTDSTININTASSSELDSLSGVGEVTAEKIINGRPYTSIEELVKKKAVSQKVFDQVKEQISTY